MKSLNALHSAARVARGLAVGCVLGAIGLGAQAADKLTFVLNWTPKADHSPYYYALKQGWYTAAGVDLTIEGGRGSGATVQRVAAGAADLGVADMATMMVARGKGADLRALMGVYTVSPQTFYWLKSSGIKSPKDFAGRKIGAPAGDAAVAMFPSFAKAAGIDPKSVTFVNVTPAAKLSALKSGTVDIVPYFFDVHDLLIDEFGDAVQFLQWKDVGLNPYGNAIFVKESALASKRKAVEAFVKVSQKAFATCMADFQPCLDAVAAATTGLNLATEAKSWKRIKFLLADDASQSTALGWIDGDRVAKDYQLIATTMGIDKPFDAKDAFTTEFLDRAVKVRSADINK